MKIWKFTMGLPTEITIYKFVLRWMQIFGLMPLVFGKGRYDDKKIKMKFSKPLLDISLIYLACATIFYTLIFGVQYLFFVESFSNLNKVVKIFASIISVVNLIAVKGIMIFKTPRVTSFLNYSLDKQYGCGSVLISDLCALIVLSIMSLIKLIQVKYRYADIGNLVFQIPTIIFNLDVEGSVSTFCAFLYFSFKRVSSNVERLSTEVQNLFFLQTSQSTETKTSKQAKLSIDKFGENELWIHQTEERIQTL